MGHQITLYVTEDFLNWWKECSPHIQKDQTMMLIAWYAWKEGRKQLRAETLGAPKE